MTEIIYMEEQREKGIKKMWSATYMQRMYQETRENSRRGKKKRMKK